MSSKQFAYIEDKDKPEKGNAQLIYSLVLIFLIPSSIILNTFWSIQKFQSNLETELQDKTVLAKNIFANSITESMQDSTALQIRLKAIAQSSKEIKEISILKPVDEGFQIEASSNINNLGLSYKSLDYTSVWLEEKDITTPVIEESNNERYWLVIAPLKNSASQKIALLNMKISMNEITTLIQQSLVQSLVMLAITIFFVLLLLFNHFHFFEYAILLKRLREVDKMKDDFISMASHELKTPMTAIKGYMSMIFEGVAGKIDNKAKIHLEKILANIKRLDVLVDSLLDVSRLQQNRVKFDMQGVDIANVLSAITSEIKVQADEKKLILEYRSLPTPHPLIFADQDRLAQIFENVIGNAIKYTFKGSISIYHRIEEDRLKTIVQDTGIGMSKQDMKKLFTRFYRIRNEKTADIPGTGLGLWITKEIVIRMNGEIYAESKEGIGSVFTIIFPIIRENKQ